MVALSVLLWRVLRHFWMVFQTENSVQLPRKDEHVSIFWTCIVISSLESRTLEQTLDTHSEYPF